MNGTVIDIPGILIFIDKIHAVGTTDKAHILTITDGERKVTLEVFYGKIQSVRSSKYNK